MSAVSGNVIAAPPTNIKSVRFVRGQGLAQDMLSVSHGLWNAPLGYRWVATDPVVAIATHSLENCFDVHRPTFLTDARDRNISQRLPRSAKPIRAEVDPPGTASSKRSQAAKTERMRVLPEVVPDSGSAVYYPV